MFHSILFCKEDCRKEEPLREPDCFKDLNLDAVFDPLLSRYKKFRLHRFFYTPLQSMEEIRYRQEVFLDLEQFRLEEPLTDFSETLFGIGLEMNRIRKDLSSSDSQKNSYLTRGKLLDCAERYIQALSDLSHRLCDCQPPSAGLSGLKDYLTQYCTSQSYLDFCSHASRLRSQLSSVRYCMLIDNGTVRIRPYEDQPDLSARILTLFEKFRQGRVQNYARKLSETPSAVHVENSVLRIVARLNKESFHELSGFCRQYLHFDDPVLIRFAEEIQFYLSWLDYIKPLKDHGLPFHVPSFCRPWNHLFAKDGFDIALAAKLHGSVVPSDFRLDRPEQILVVTGPNQGGKTTFARAFGQLHYLGLLGLEIPGSASMLCLTDRIFTHFEKEETLSTLSGKLREELIRLREILQNATSDSIVIINEIFSSTTLCDAELLGKQMLKALIHLGAPAVVVTFLDELACFGPETVSTVSTVSEDNPSERTFRLVRRPPDGLAHAMCMAERHGLTYRQLKRRLENGSSSDVS